MKMFEEVRSWYYEELLKRAANSLNQNGFNAHLARSIDEAKEKILGLIDKNESVAIGGSVTIREIGIIEELERRGNKVLQHWIKASPEEIYKIRREEMKCDVFLTSANAITIDGKLINIDGVGNRVAAMIFGPRKVIVVAGRNKIVRNVEEGLFRARNVAAVMNNKRLGSTNPCTKLGYCNECKGNERICRVTVILERNPSETEYHVILLPFELGF